MVEVLSDLISYHGQSPSTQFAFDGEATPMPVWPVLCSGRSPRSPEGSPELAAVTRGAPQGVMGG